MYAQTYAGNNSPHAQAYSCSAGGADQVILLRGRHNLKLAA